KISKIKQKIILYEKKLEIFKTNNKKSFYKTNNKKPFFVQLKFKIIKKNDYFANITTKNNILKNILIQEIITNDYKNNIAHIPEERHRDGLFLDLPAYENSIINDTQKFTKHGFLNRKKIWEYFHFIEKKYDVRGVQNKKTLSRHLSGGNQQKIIIGRELERRSKFLIAANPTRGLDVGSIRNVYENIIQFRNSGNSVILMSGELDEIIQVSDRIMVLNKGKIVEIFRPKKYSKLEIGMLMANGKIEVGFK
ncbi:MAG: hypothetical protein K4H23_05530, partial [Mollicutes bacterium PWAP]|nr:hypothetical protein [Mollicutes bacterium PWAP]